MQHVLDHPIWNALISGNKELAIGNENVKCFPKNISPLIGLKNTDQSDFDELLTIVSEQDRPIFTATHPIIVPDQWQVDLCIEADQMVHDGAVPKMEQRAELIPLKNEHVDQMLALTRLTKPGPFEVNTIALGNYEGVLEQGKLIAMTGQRLKVDDFIEISAVCTHPDFLGKGYAKQLLISQINQIISQSKTPFLHVNSKNARAIGVYERLGFQLRTKILFYIIRKKEA